MVGFEAQQVIGLRMLNTISGKPLDLARLSVEKMDAAVASTLATTKELVTGGSPLRASHKGLAVYARKVKASRRNLTRKRQ